jgi:hypothetical protein
MKKRVVMKNGYSIFFLFLPFLLIGCSNPTTEGPESKQSSYGEKSKATNNLELHSGIDIVCDVSITNRGKKKAIKINGDTGKYISRIIDEYGNEFKAGKIRFGRKESHSPQTLLARNVPKTATIRFKNITQIPSTLPILELGLYSEDSDYGNFNVTFRKVPIGRTKQVIPKVIFYDFSFQLNECKLVSSE